MNTSPTTKGKDTAGRVFAGVSDTPSNAGAGIPTPGPWAVDFEQCYVHAPGNACLADVAHMTGPRWAEGQANARLIAAAPELLAALTRAERQLSARYTANLSRSLCSTDGHRADASLGDDLFVVRAAIAKAEGRL